MTIKTLTIVLIKTIYLKYHKRIQISKKLNFLINSINLILPKLANSKFELKTKIYWILNDLSDFPKCVNCGKSILRNIKTIINPKYKYCSSNCAHTSQEMVKLVKKTKLEKYGNETYTNREKAKQTVSQQSDEFKKQIKEKFKQTCQQKYGVDNPSQLNSVIEKIKHTRFLKYNAYESIESKVKRKKTFIEHYGVDNNMKSIEGKNKFIKAIREKYHDNNITSTTQVKEIADKISKTWIKKLQDDDFKKQRSINLKKNIR